MEQRVDLKIDKELLKIAAMKAVELGISRRKYLQEIIVNQLSKIKYGKEKELLNIGIEKFLKSKYWLAIRKKRMDTREIKTTKTKADNEF